MKRLSPCIRLRCESGVSDAVRQECRRVVRWFPTLSEVRHLIHVQVVATAYLEDWDGEIGERPAGPARPLAGYFTSPFRSMRRYPCFVTVAGRPPAAEYRRFLVKNGRGRSMSARVVAQVLLHELAHYERYRDNRAQNEFGIEARASALYKSIDALDDLARRAEVSWRRCKRKPNARTISR